MSWKNNVLTRIAGLVLACCLGISALPASAKAPAARAVQNNPQQNVPYKILAKSGTTAKASPSVATGVPAPAVSAPAVYGNANPVMPIADKSVAPAATPSQSTDPVYSYRLGTGDKIRLIVFGELALSGEFTISGEGKVSLPLIGEIVAAGLTASQLQAKIETALLEGYLKDPKVNVEVLTFRPYYIYGEVIKPGEYPYANGMTVDKAVATASGYTYRADKKKAYVKHATEDKEVVVLLNSQVPVQPGDTIRIGERYF